MIRLTTVVDGLLQDHYVLCSLVLIGLPWILEILQIAFALNEDYVVSQVAMHLEIRIALIWIVISLVLISLAIILRLLLLTAHITLSYIIDNQSLGWAVRLPK